MIHFDVPKNQSSIIKVIGVGGGGSNAVNYMYSLGIEGVDFVVCNTDQQALTLSPVPNKIQLGPHLTSGLGAGANPEIGKQSCEESLEDIEKILKTHTRMVFITAGMGGGTGTGGAPVVAKLCRDMGILTVGIVTTPFSYEGRRRMKQAQEGIERMRGHVDTVLVISNDKLREQFGNLPFTKAFAKADGILATAAKCITDVITSTGQVNVDFADVCTVMRNGGVAILGSATASGENRATEAVEQALNSPLLNDSDIRGAKWLLLNITSSTGEFEHTMDEADAIQAYVQRAAGENCDVILGMGHDPNLEDKIGVTVIATGFDYKEINEENLAKSKEPEKVQFKLEDKNGNASLASAAPNTSFDRPEPFNWMPKLVEHDASPKEPVEAVTKTELPTEPAIQPFSFNYREEKTDTPEEPGFKLVIKDEEPAPAKPVMKIGGRILSEEEMEDQRQREARDRAISERAERLRNMSINIGGEGSQDKRESIPAFERRNLGLDYNSPSQTEHYSKTTVGRDLDNNEGLQTKNNFLDGDRPC
jgi:cell division protein FtsZ